MGTGLVTAPVELERKRKGTGLSDVGLAALRCLSCLSFTGNLWQRERLVCRLPRSNSHICKTARMVWASVLWLWRLCLHPLPTKTRATKTHVYFASMPPHMQFIFSCGRNSSNSRSVPQPQYVQQVQLQVQLRVQLQVQPQLQQAQQPLLQPPPPSQGLCRVHWFVFRRWAGSSAGAELRSSVGRQFGGCYALHVVFRGASALGVS